MEDKNELIDKLTSYQKFNTEKSEKFTENQKTTFAQKRKEFYSIYEILRNLYLEVDSIDLEIYGTSKVTALPPIKKRNKTLRRPIPGVSYLATSGLLEDLMP